MNSKQVKELEKEHVMQTYARQDLVVEKGRGCYVYDKEGKRYLDFLGAIATCSVGHGNIKVANAIYRQAKKIITITNLYYSEPQVLLAKKLSELSGLKKCFFCNSGSEANEAAIKLAKKITGKKKFIAFENSFHGRTTGSLAATWKAKYREPFAPLSPAVEFVKYGDASALRKAITKETAAVILEPIQGEAGIIMPGKGFLKEVRKICDENKILMIVDEVQTGTARTGKFFAYQNEGIKPDIVTVAKGLASGVPIGACISDFDFALGDHGSTFGGNNVSCAAALATIDCIEEKNLLKNADAVGNYFMAKLNALKAGKKIIKEVRGKGLIIGVELKENKAKDIVKKCLENGLLCNAATDSVLRFLPPLVTTKKEVDSAIKILEKAM